MTFCQRNINRLLFLCRTFYRKFFRPRTIRNNGIKLCIDKTFSGTTIDQLYKGMYEQHENIILNGGVDENDRVLDIGSSIGYISIKVAKMLASSNQILCFEANPRIIPFFLKNSKLNDLKLHVNNCVLSSANGSVDFYIHHDFTSSSLLTAPHMEKINIPQKDINEVISEFKANFLIMDIEGGEAELIPMIDLTPINKICVEIHPACIGMNKSSELIKYLLVEGFNLHRFVGNCFFFLRPTTNSKVPEALWTGEFGT